MNPARRCKPATAPEGGESLQSGLYLVSVPIGNSADITLRAIDVLSRADVIACEDTRSFRRLAQILGISLRGRAPVSYHDRSRAGVLARIRGELVAGKSVAYAPEAGTALVSDPGYRLVQVAVDAGVPVRPVPGPASPLAALVAAGLPTDRFLFAGFPPARAGARRRFLAELAGTKATLVFCEAPHRLAASLSDMASAFGDRPAVIARELTKAFEELRRGTLVELAADAADTNARGEHVVLVGAAGEPDPPPQDIDAAIRRACRGATRRDAARQVAAATGLSRREAYRRVLAAASDDEE